MTKTWLKTYFDFMILISGELEFSADYSISGTVRSDIFVSGKRRVFINSNTWIAAVIFAARTFFVTRFDLKLELQTILALPLVLSRATTCTSCDVRSLFDAKLAPWKIASLNELSSNETNLMQMLNFVLAYVINLSNAIARFLSGSESWDATGKPNIKSGLPAAAI